MFQSPRSLGVRAQHVMTPLPCGLSQDALQETYNQKGVFPGEPFKPARRPWTLLNFLFWATVLLSPLFRFVLGVFASGSPLLILTFLGFVGAGKEYEGCHSSRPGPAVPPRRRPGLQTIAVPGRHQGAGIHARPRGLSAGSSHSAAGVICSVGTGRAGQRAAGGACLPPPGLPIMISQLIHLTHLSPVLKLPLESAD